ncbi:MAG: ferredoxin [Myxococcales bacterium]|nr:ferredoxin [Myxococcales bacterium]
MLTIRHKKPECIGCDMCVELAPAYWAMGDDGLAYLRIVARTRGDFSFGEGFEDDRDLLIEVADECPVAIIEIG